MKVNHRFFSQMGEAGILFDPNPETSVSSYEVQRRIWLIAEELTKLEGIFELVPGMNNLLSLYDPIKFNSSDIQNLISAAWERSSDDVSALERCIEHSVPVTYGGIDGEDLLDVSRRVGLSVDEVISIHTKSEFTVFAIGSQPGLPYMGGMDKRLILPRREVPRTSVKAGSVIIGGAQASILSRTSACGWHILGSTNINCFDVEEIPPTKFLPGDKVRFTVQDVVV